MSVARTIAADLRLAAQSLRDARTLLTGGSRNAAYLASQSLELIVRAISTAEGLHIERAKAHQIDTNVRALPNTNPDKPELSDVAVLESYATSYRYPTAAGRIVPAPKPDVLRQQLDKIEQLLIRLSEHFQVDLDHEGPARRVDPRR